MDDLCRFQIGDLIWCGRRGSNPHDQRPRDFKSHMMHSKYLFYNDKYRFYLCMCTILCTDSRRNSHSSHGNLIVVPGNKRELEKSHGAADIGIPRRPATSSLTEMSPHTCLASSRFLNSLDESWGGGCRARRSGSSIVLPRAEPQLR